MTTETSSDQSMKEKTWLHSGKILIACSVAIFLCWFFIQSAQSSSLGKTPEVPNPDVLTGHDPDILAQASSLVITKTHTPADFLIGQPGDLFNIDIRNTSPISGPLTVADNLPAGLTLASQSGDFSCGPIGGQNITCTYTNTAGLPSGSSLSIQLGVNVAAAAAPVVTNTVTLSHAGDTPVTDSDRVTIVSSDLAVTKSVSPTNPNVGGTVTYLVRLRNLGPSPTTGVVLTDTLDTHLTYSSSSATQGNYVSGTGRWSVPTLGVNEIVTLTLSATVNTNAMGLTIVDATNGVSSDQYDYNTANNTASASIQVTSPVDLSITKTDNQTSVSPGATYSYTITVENNGTIDIPNYVITDTLSDFLTFITDTMGVDYTKTGSNYIWDITQALAAGHGKDFFVKVKVDSSLPSASTSIVNTVKVGSTFRESNVANNTATDTNTAAGTRSVSISNSVSPTSVQTGQNATYTIRVTNNGSASVTDVEVTDAFSSYVDIVSTSTSRGSKDVSSRTLTVNISSLNAGQTATITVKVKINDTATFNTTVSNSAYLTYLFGTTTYSGSASASFSLVRTSTLPGTGGIEPSVRPEEAPPSRIYLVALFSTILLCALGIATFGYGVRARARASAWSGFAIKMGFMFIVAGMLFGLAAWGLAAVARQESPSILAERLKSEGELKATPPWPEDPAWVGEYHQNEPEVLPDFPIPEPTNVAPDESGNSPDTSPINRIALPGLGIDTVVKYVPYDGFTWLIAGLQQEVAWMGDTSWPGLGGNTALAGHVTLRNGRDGPFRNLDQLQPNDVVTLYTEKNVYTYRVRESRVVPEIDMTVIAPTEKPQLTLITCIHFNPDLRQYTDRLIVFADLVEVTAMRDTVSGN